MGGTQFLQMLISQGDYLCLGLAGVSEASIGVYYFAYRLSTQSFMLIANSVPMVLFPSLSQLVLDPGKQLRGTIRASRLLAVVAIPFCLLQILLAERVIHLVCPPRWLEAVVPLQILTVGIMVNAPAWPSNSLLMAQRRFRELLRLSVICTVTFFFAVGGAVDRKEHYFSCGCGMLVVFVGDSLLFLGGRPTALSFPRLLRPGLSAIYRRLGSVCVVLASAAPIPVGSCWRLGGSSGHHDLIFCDIHSVASQLGK